MEKANHRLFTDGILCLPLQDELAVIFAEYDQGNLEGTSYKLACCDGLAMDLLASISRELKFEIDLFLVPDGYFGARLVRLPTKTKKAFRLLDENYI